MIGRFFSIILSVLFLFVLANCKGGDTGVSGTVMNDSVTGLSTGDITTELEVIEVGPGDGRPEPAAEALAIERTCMATNAFAKITELRFFHAFADFPGKRFVEIVLEENTVKTLLFVEFPGDNHTFDFMGSSIATNLVINSIMSDSAITTVDYKYGGNLIVDDMTCE